MTVVTTLHHLLLMIAGGPGEPRDAEKFLGRRTTEFGVTVVQPLERGTHLVNQLVDDGSARRRVARSNHRLDDRVEQLAVDDPGGSCSDKAGPGRPGLGLWSTFLYGMCPYGICLCGHRLRLLLSCRSTRDRVGLGARPRVWRDLTHPQPCLPRLPRGRGPSQQDRCRHSHE